MSIIDLKTHKQAVSAVKEANEVYVYPRYGSSGLWVKITKKEALWFLDKNRDIDIEEMYTKTFGTVENGKYVYLG